MPLYEIVLCFGDRAEVRLTDCPVAIGERLRIDYKDWHVVLERTPADMQATARFLCVLTKEQRYRVASMSAGNGALREKLAARRAEYVQPDKAVSERVLPGIPRPTRPAR